MPYKITVRSHRSYATFIVSLTAINAIFAKQEVLRMYPDHSVVKVEPGRCITW
jgi:hypothetical protein